jgi:hypothetical protein
MRKQILGATAALLGAGTLTLGLPAAPTHGADWKTIDAIPFPAGSISEIEVVSTGDGDAVAAAIVDGGVVAATANDGFWAGTAQVRGPVNATGLALTTNANGDVVVGWKEDASGDTRFAISRQTGQTTFTGAQYVTPGNGADVVGNPDLGITAGRKVIVAATIDDEGDDINNELITVAAAEGQSGVSTKVISAGDSWNPALDVNSKGEALLSWTYTGLSTDVVNVARRSAAGVWNLGNTTHNSDDVASATDVAISDNGQGQVVYAVVKNGFYVAASARILPDGTVQTADVISPLDEYVYEPSVDINATGSALFTWVAKKNGISQVRYATAANAADPTSAQLLPGSAPDLVDPTARIADNGLRVIQYAGSGHVTTQYRTSAVQPWVASSTASGFASAHGVDVDPAGNAVMVGFQPSGASARFLDAHGPAVTIYPLPANRLALDVDFAWWAFDTLSSAQGISDVYLSKASWNQAAYGEPFLLDNDVAATEDTFDAVPGTSYCIQVRLGDTAGNYSNSEKECTTVPLDDNALAGTGWNRHDEVGNFHGTLSTTQKQGRVLSITGVKAKRLALVVKKVANGGTVKVTFAGDSLGSFSLQGTGKRKVVALKTFGSVRTGTLKITVTSADGKLVSIDGLVVAK